MWLTRWSGSWWEVLPRMWPSPILPAHEGLQKVYRGFTKEIGHANDSSLGMGGSCTGNGCLPPSAKTGVGHARRWARGRPGSHQRSYDRAANRMEPRRCGRVSGGILAFAGTDVFRKQRRGTRLGRRAGAIQEELSRQRGDGTAGFFGAGVSVFGAGRGARPGAVAFEAGKR